MAGVRLVAGVRAGMPNQVASLGKTHAALGAHVQPLSRVQPPVLCQVIVPLEGLAGLAASAAGEGPRPLVDLLVLEHSVFVVAREGAQAAPMPVLHMGLRPVQGVR